MALGVCHSGTEFLSAQKRNSIIQIRLYIPRFGEAKDWGFIAFLFHFLSFLSHGTEKKNEAS